MSEELAKCPACDSTMMWPQPGNEEAICSNTNCGYQVNVWDHHVLARRAEVGRLVETVMPPSGRNLTISHNEEGGASAFCVGKHGTGPTPLDALRALAAKLGMTDEKGELNR